MSTLSTSIRSAFEARGHLVRPRGAENFTTTCPAHDDTSPSLDVDFRDGKALFICRSHGCPTEAVMSAVGLEWTDMWEDDGSLARQTLLRGEPVCIYRYVKPDGSPYMEVGRWFDKQFRPRPAGQTRWGLPQGFRQCLYRLDRVQPAAQNGEDIWIVEGEKDVHAAERLGLVATTMPGGTSRMRHLDDWNLGFLEGAGSITVVADRDETGRKAARLLAEQLESVGHTVRLVAAAEGKDMYAHVTAGLGVDAFLPLEEEELPLVSLQQLMDTEYPEPDFILPGLLPPGLAMLAGSSKVGKSMLALDLALAVAHEGKAWSGVEVDSSGAVLYLALDNDNERRFKSRARDMLQQDLDPTVPLDLATTWGQGEEARSQIRAWHRRRAKDRPVLVVVDLGANVEPRLLGGGPRDNDYTVVSQALREWHQLSQELGLCVLMLHHDRKPSGQGSNDFVDDFIGSRAVTGGIATLWMLRRQRSSPEATLHVTGRDVGEAELELRFSNGRYLLFSMPEDLSRLGSYQQRIVTYVRSSPTPVTRAELMTAFPDIKPQSLDQYLHRSVKAKRLTRQAMGVYGA